MARLKNPQVPPPNGWDYWEPAIRFKAPKNSSLDSLTRALIAARLGNPAITARMGWSTDYETVKRQVDEYNAKICQIHGWFDYVEPDVPQQPPPRSFPDAPRRQPPTLSGGARNVVAGAKTITEMLGPEGPVDAATAINRAAICIACPLNDLDPNWLSYFTQPAAAMITRMFEGFRGLNLRTPVDDKLGVCSACDCPMRLKIWARLPHILKHIPEEAKVRLHPSCWITK